MERNWTTGNIFRNVLLFSAPFLLSFFLQTLYGMADLFIIGQYEGGASTTAVSVGAQVMHMLTVMLVGLVENEIACVGSISASSRERIAHLGEAAVSVAKKYWRLGIGEALMKELMAFARQTGRLKTIYLGVRDGNDGAIALYHKLGFLEYGRFPGFFQINGQFQDEILMYKEL